MAKRRIKNGGQVERRADSWAKHSGDVRNQLWEALGLEKSISRGLASLQGEDPCRRG